MKTYSQKTAEVERNWRIVDAQDKVLGRLASQIAVTLRGKDKATFTPHIDGGDFVIVVNAEKVHLTGAKEDGKIYYQHTRFRGGLKSWPARRMREIHPEEMIRRAVWGMLPKGPLGREMIKKLKVYKGSAHPHVAQQPKPLAIAK
ncbi:MAG TPA: 50S ribosomal protein L13 [Bdellovibrionota bacterium]|nr:50S ribosomal protein L13 [Bdellovibrionota bacterium]